MREPTNPLRQPTKGAAHASPAAVSLQRTLIVCLIAGAFLALIGPLGTDEASLALRLGYWLVATVAGGVIGWAVTLLVLRWLPLRNRPWPTILAIAGLMSWPTTAMIWVWGQLAFASHIPVSQLPELYGSVLVICLAMTAINRLTLPSGPVSDVAAEASAVRAAFLDRLPPRLRGAALYAVEAQDHYLRVHTAAGSDLILLRLSDALAELALLNGAQTHRSWWVARDAVSDIRRHDGRATLTLRNGLAVLVSRAHAAGLRQARWL